MDPALFKKFCELIHTTCGIALTDAKESLLTARMSKRIRALGLSSEQEYFAFVTDPKNSNEIIQFVDVISTNVTSFFREAEHFDILSKMLQLWESKGQTSFRIWCAASSSGEEPYTIAITAKESLQNPNSTVKILATDISTKVLQQAIEGKYPKEKTKGLPEHILKKYFREISEGNQVYFEASQEIKNMIKFGRLNLNNLPIPLTGGIDIIFCRNVMIYFDRELKQKLVDNFLQLVRPGGMLFISLTESLAGLRSPFKMQWPAVFFKSSGLDRDINAITRD